MQKTSTRAKSLLAAAILVLSAATAGPAPQTLTRSVEALPAATTIVTE